MRKLENKVVIVTGASSGIGAATARLFAAEGASLALASRAIHKLQALAASLGPRAIAIETDITDPVQVQEMVRRCAGRFGLENSPPDMDRREPLCVRPLSLARS